MRKSQWRRLNKMSKHCCLKCWTCAHVSASPMHSGPSGHCAIILSKAKPFRRSAVARCVVNLVRHTKPTDDDRPTQTHNNAMQVLACRSLLIRYNVWPQGLNERHTFQSERLLTKTDTRTRHWRVLSSHRHSNRIVQYNWQCCEKSARISFAFIIIFTHIIIKINT